MISTAAPRRRRKRNVPHLAACDRAGVPVVSIPHDRAWDAGDLDRLCQAVERLAAGHDVVGIDLRGAHRLPVGFWDRLCRWGEQGLGVVLFDPEPTVRAMLWFRLSARPYAAVPDAYAVSHRHETLAGDDSPAPTGTRIA